MSMGLTITTPTALSEGCRRCGGVKQEEEESINSLIKGLKRREAFFHLQLLL